MLSVGILGFGSLGKYLCNEIEKSSDFKLAFVWNRTREKLNRKVDSRIILDNLDEIPCVDLIIEVCHPCVIGKFGVDMLAKANLMIQSLHVTMKKHPSCFKLESPLKEMNDAVTEAETILYNGPVSALCPLAPNNVNTMAVSCIAAKSLGFDNVMATLVSDPTIFFDHHVVQGAPGRCQTVVRIELESKGGLKVVTERINPCNLGVVTGYATYGSFLSSLKSKNLPRPEAPPS